MRKNYKMILAIVMALLLTVSATACAGRVLADNETEATAEKQVPTETSIETEAVPTEPSEPATEEPTEEETTEATEITEATEATEPEKVTEAPTEETKPNTTGNKQPSEEEKPAETDPPVTNPPVTNPPVTNPPVTEPLVTESPTTEPPTTEPPATEPPATEPPATDPPVTEPPAPTECVHNWETIYHAEVGYWTDPYVVCGCGAKFATEPEWWAHAQSYIGTEDISHCSWGGAQDYIVTSPPYDEDICKLCGKSIIHKLVWYDYSKCPGWG